MATVALLNMKLVFNAIDLSDHARATTVTAEASALSSEAFGDTWTEATGGLKSGTLAVQLLDDFALASVDATLWAAFNANVLVSFAVRPVNAAISTTNPEYQGFILPNAFNVGGSLNEMAAKQLSFPLSGALVRAVA